MRCDLETSYPGAVSTLVQQVHNTASVEVSFLDSYDVTYNQLKRCGENIKKLPGNSIMVIV